MAYRKVLRHISWAPPGLWMVALFFLFTMPVDVEPTPWLPPFIDKVIHFILFAVLAWLLVLPFTLGLVWTLAAATVPSFIIASLYGMWTEYVQTAIPYRDGNLGDVIANTLGAATVFAAVWIVPPVIEMLKDRFTSSDRRAG